MLIAFVIRMYLQSVTRQAHQGGGSKIGSNATGRNGIVWDCTAMEFRENSALWDCIGSYGTNRLELISPSFSAHLTTILTTATRDVCRR